MCQQIEERASRITVFVLRKSVKRGEHAFEMCNAFFWSEHLLKVLEDWLDDLLFLALSNVVFRQCFEDGLHIQQVEASRGKPRLDDFLGYLLDEMCRDVFTYDRLQSHIGLVPIHVGLVPPLVLAYLNQ